MSNEFLSSKEIYTGFYESPNLKNKLIISFMLSTGIKSDYIVNLSIKELLIGCGMDINDKNALRNLLDNDPIEILPYWIINNEPNIKLVFNSYEASFYLFLYLKGRLDNIQNFDEPLFSSNDNGKKYGAKTIREMITKNQSNKNFRQTSLVNKFRNICENRITDDEIKNLFLGKSNNYESKDQLKEKLKDDLFMDRLIIEYKKIVPYLTSSYYMYEHLNNFISSPNVKENYKEKIKNYFDNNFIMHYRDFNDIDKGKLLANAYHIARLDMDQTDNYQDNDLYYDNLLKKAEITTVFNNSKYCVSFHDFAAYSDIIDYDHYYSELFTEERIKLIFDCITELKVIEKYNLNPEDVRGEIINQLAFSGCIDDAFPYFAFEKVVLQSIFELLGI